MAESRLEQLAQVMASERYQAYLQKRPSFSSSSGGLPLSPPVLPPSELIWTGAESHFVELIYGFIEAKVFNGGIVTLKVLSESLATAWGVTLTQDISRTWISLKGRSKGADLFLQTVAMGVRKRAKKQEMREKVSKK
ncbi:MAG: RteC domain-containing protein [Spirosomaceae bacterium]|jgi:hypothetical protein|nr:RteC domain-containing protein [Spirosomataceae bacterium]